MKMLSNWIFIICTFATLAVFRQSDGRRGRPGIPIVYGCNFDVDGCYQTRCVVYYPGTGAVKTGVMCNSLTEYLYRMNNSGCTFLRFSRINRHLIHSNLVPPEQCNTPNVFAVYQPENGCKPRWYNATELKNVFFYRKHDCLNILQENELSRLPVLFECDSTTDNCDSNEYVMYEPAIHKLSKVDMSCSLLRAQNYSYIRRYKNWCMKHTTGPYAKRIPGWYCNVGGKQEGFRGGNCEPQWYDTEQFVTDEFLFEDREECLSGRQKLGISKHCPVNEIDSSYNSPCEKKCVDGESNLASYTTACSRDDEHNCVCKSTMARNRRGKCIWDALCGRD